MLRRIVSFLWQKSNIKSQSQKEHLDSSNHSTKYIILKREHRWFESSLHKSKISNLLTFNLSITDKIETIYWISPFIRRGRGVNSRQWQCSAAEKWGIQATFEIRKLVNEIKLSPLSHARGRVLLTADTAQFVCGVLLSVNVQGVRASSGGEDGVSAEHREQSGRGLRWVLLSVPARCAAKYYCRELHVRAARVWAERHAGDLHTPGTGRGGTLHTNTCNLMPGPQ